ncbi:unnamed protein product, partial [marine sediment metagenome]
NCQGQIVSSPMNAYVSKGNHTVDLGGSSLTNGTYYLRISTSIYKNTRKLLILK